MDQRGSRARGLPEPWNGSEICRFDSRRSRAHHRSHTHDSLRPVLHEQLVLRLAETIDEYALTLRIVNDSSSCGIWLWTEIQEVFCT